MSSQQRPEVESSGEPSAELKPTPTKQSRPLPEDSETSPAKKQKPAEIAGNPEDVAALVAKAHSSKAWPEKTLLSLFRFVEKALADQERVKLTEEELYEIRGKLNLDSEKATIMQINRYLRARAGARK